ncbi:DNA polymerase zeta catalytic subunit-like isoform X2 [Anneissia japonica]|uniref:DNA polymerase zeta catalytic subunit-like isoform X2 n=1 Tax=Anneissia japonica TaxID=1529436 RepID=UPI001425AC02|nr:DNA polymerase zeta catalytic subunit-like isoform X2 [Anneissia japonica]
MGDKMLSVRIVTADNYMAEPIPQLDITYSDFRGCEVKRVPVVRVFGATPTGQKTCLHVHGLLPYIYVPYDGPQPVDEQYLHRFAVSIDKALQVAMNQSTNSTIHVFKITLVSGIPFYGYYEEEKQFMKIYFCNPIMVKKAVDLLHGGAVMNKVHQPHEAHIPFLLQFFIDYNLSGMDLINLSAFKFRRSSDDENQAKSTLAIKDASSTGYGSFHSNVPSTEYGNTSEVQSPELVDVARQSMCELEIDCVAVDILNRLQIEKNVGKNPGLMAIWEDEKQRRKELNQLSQLLPPSSPERGFVPPTESERQHLARLDTIIQQQCALLKSQIDSEDDNSSSQDTLHLSQSDASFIKSPNQSQDSISMQEVEPCIDEEAVLSVVSASQSFSMSQALGATQDKQLIALLAELAEDNSPEDDSILSGLSQRKTKEDENVISQKDIEEEEDEDMLMMTQAWDEDIEDVAEMSTQNSGKTSPDEMDIHLSWLNDSFDLNEEKPGGNFPQVDGGSDEKEAMQYIAKKPKTLGARRRNIQTEKPKVAKQGPKICKMKARGISMEMQLENRIYRLDNVNMKEISSIQEADPNRLKEVEMKEGVQPMQEATQINNKQLENEHTERVFTEMKKFKTDVKTVDALTIKDASDEDLSHQKMQLKDSGLGEDSWCVKDSAVVRCKEQYKNNPQGLPKSDTTLPINCAIPEVVYSKDSTGGEIKGISWDNTICYRMAQKKSESKTDKIYTTIDTQVFNSMKAPTVMKQVYKDTSEMSLTATINSKDKPCPETKTCMYANETVKDVVNNKCFPVKLTKMENLDSMHYVSISDEDFQQERCAFKRNRTNKTNPNCKRKSRNVNRTWKSRTLPCKANGKFRELVEDFMVGKSFDDEDDFKTKEKKKTSVASKLLLDDNPFKGCRTLKVLINKVSADKQTIILTKKFMKQVQKQLSQIKAIQLGSLQNENKNSTSESNTNHPKKSNKKLLAYKKSRVKASLVFLDNDQPVKDVISSLKNETKHGLEILQCDLNNRKDASNDSQHKNHLKIRNESEDSGSRLTSLKSSDVSNHSNPRVGIKLMKRDGNLIVQDINSTFSGTNNDKSQFKSRQKPSKLSRQFSTGEIKVKKLPEQMFDTDNTDCDSLYEDVLRSLAYYSPVPESRCSSPPKCWSPTFSFDVPDVNTVILSEGVNTSNKNDLSQQIKEDKNLSSKNQVLSSLGAIVADSLDNTHQINTPSNTSCDVSHRNHCAQNAQCGNTVELTSGNNVNLAAQDNEQSLEDVITDTTQSAFKPMNKDRKSISSPKKQKNKDNQQVCSVGTPSDNQKSYSVGTLRCNQQVSSVGSPKDKQQVCSVGTPDDNQLICSVGTPKDNQQVCSIGTPKDNQQVCSVGTPKDNQQVWSVGTPKDNQQVCSVDTPKDNQQVSSVATPKNNQQSCTVGTLKDNQVVCSVSTQKHKQQVCSIDKLKDNQQVGTSGTPRDNQVPTVVIPKVNQQVHLTGTQTENQKDVAIVRPQGKLFDKPQDKFHQNLSAKPPSSNLQPPISTVIPPKHPCQPNQPYCQQKHSSVRRYGSSKISSPIGTSLINPDPSSPHVYHSNCSPSNQQCIHSTKEPVHHQFTKPSARCNVPMINWSPIESQSHQHHIQRPYKGNAAGTTLEAYNSQFGKIWTPSRSWNPNLITNLNIAIGDFQTSSNSSTIQSPQSCSVSCNQVYNQRIMGLQNNMPVTPVDISKSNMLTDISCKQPVDKKPKKARRVRRKRLIQTSEDNSQMPEKKRRKTEKNQSQIDQVNSTLLHDSMETIETLPKNNLINDSKINTFPCETSPSSSEMSGMPILKNLLCSTNNNKVNSNEEGECESTSFLDLFREAIRAQNEEIEMALSQEVTYSEEPVMLTSELDIKKDTGTRSSEHTNDKISNENVMEAHSFDSQMSMLSQRSTTNGHTSATQCNTDIVQINKNNIGTNTSDYSEQSKSMKSGNGLENSEYLSDSLYSTCSGSNDETSHLQDSPGLLIDSASVNTGKNKLSMTGGKSPIIPIPCQETKQNKTAVISLPKTEVLDFLGKGGIEVQQYLPEITPKLTSSPCLPSHKSTDTMSNSSLIPSDENVQSSLQQISKANYNIVGGTRSEVQDHLSKSFNAHIKEPLSVSCNTKKVENIGRSSPVIPWQGSLDIPNTGSQDVVDTLRNSVQVKSNPSETNSKCVNVSTVREEQMELDKTSKELKLSSSSIHGERRCTNKQKSEMIDKQHILMYREPADDIDDESISTPKATLPKIMKSTSEGNEEDVYHNMKFETNEDQESLTDINHDNDLDSEQSKSSKIEDESILDMSLSPPILKTSDRNDQSFPIYSVPNTPDSSGFSSQNSFSEIAIPDTPDSNRTSVSISDTEPLKLSQQHSHEERVDVADQNISNQDIVDDKILPVSQPRKRHFQCTDASLEDISMMSFCSPLKSCTKIAGTNETRSDKSDQGTPKKEERAASQKEDHEPKQSPQSPISQDKPSDSQPNDGQPLSSVTERLKVWQPQQTPPSRTAVVESLAKYGLKEFYHQEAYCRNPADLPDKSSNQPVHHNRIKSLIPSEFPKFDSILSTNGIQHWRRLLAFSNLPSGSQDVNSSFQLINEIENRPELRALTLGNKVTAITPCKMPPSRSEVMKWMTGKELYRQNKRRKLDETETNEDFDETISVVKNVDKEDMKVVEKGIDETHGSLPLSSQPEFGHFNDSNVCTPVSKKSKTSFALLQSSQPQHSTPLREISTPPHITQLTPIAERTEASKRQDKTEQQKPQLNRQNLETFATPVTRKASDLSIIEGPTPNNTYGFKMSQHNLQDAKAVHEVQHITVMSLEIHCRCRLNYRPDPEADAIFAIFYCIQSDSDPSEKLTGVITLDPNSAADGSIQSTSLGKRSFLARAGIGKLEENVVASEQAMFEELVKVVNRYDPDFFVGYEIQMLSWGYLLQRAEFLEINLYSQLSRIPDVIAKQSKFSGHKDEWHSFYVSDINIVGRVVLNLWRLLRHEVALTNYRFENVAFHVLHQRIPEYSFRCLSDWFDHKTDLYRWRTIEHYVTRVLGIMKLLNQLDLIGRTSELARLFGIQFYSVLSRGSQYRVESMMLRLAKPMNYIAISPSVQQRARMKAPECIPLVMEPESRFYEDPVIVLDFQSLYPSMMMAYNYCYSTCLGRIEGLSEDGEFKFGCTTYSIAHKNLRKLFNKNDIHVSPNGIAFVKSHVRRGVLPRMVEEILGARVMVKKAMKDHKQNKVLLRMLDSRQLGLKLIANVTYGYTAASFSGRMPCVEIADSIVRKARETLERAIHLVESSDRWDAQVVYGDTDSLFILVKGVSKEQAFKIGKEMVDAVTADNPKPVKLKFEKVYHPCVLQSKKRYVGYSYETLDQKEPIFDAKGIETVRRDNCPAVGKILERSIKLLFNTHDISEVKSYVKRQCNKVLEGRISLQDFIFAKEYRGKSSYRPGACVPALELAKRMLSNDHRSEPRTGERVPYVIVYGSPGLPLIQLVRSPIDVIQNPSQRLNAIYYVTKQILPPLDRIMSLFGVDVHQWYNELPKVVKLAPPIALGTESKQGTISQYFNTMNCEMCEQLTKTGICSNCRKNPQNVATTLCYRMHDVEKTYSALKTVSINLVLIFFKI